MVHLFVLGFVFPPLVQFVKNINVRVKEPKVVKRQMEKHSFLFIDFCPFFLKNCCIFFFTFRINFLYLQME